jgi:hypothetical protein
MHDAEWERVKQAAPRLRRGWYGSLRPAEFGREVLLNWADHINGLPRDAKPEFPREAVLRLEMELTVALERIRELEAEQRGAGARTAPLELRDAANQATPGRRARPKRAAGGRGGL